MMSVGERAAEIILANLAIEPREPLPSGLASKRMISDDVSLNLDFRSFMKIGLPPQEYWSRWFQPGLEKVKDALVSRNLLSLRLYAFSHLSLGFMFGNVFRSTGGYRLEIRQVTRDKMRIWATTATPGRNPLRIAVFPGSLGSRDLCVKINLMSPDDSSVTRYLTQYRIRPRATLEFQPGKYPLVIFRSGSSCYCGGSSEQDQGPARVL